ncbi:MAG: TonB-dependent receptor [Candidatus Sulfotelmatobacter sp.]
MKVSRPKPLRLLARLAVLLLGMPAFAQSNRGELRLKVTDPHGLGLKTQVEMVSESNQYHNTFMTDESGELIAKRLAFGPYVIQIREPGLADVSLAIEIRSAVPVYRSVQMSLASVNTSVTVQDRFTLLDPHRAGSVNEIGQQTIQDRMTSLPGRSLQDLVNSQPGWLYEGNAVLHPRGAEYQTQFVVDGIPLTDNRSPGVGPELEADDVDSLSIYTAGIPAEFGRKMGGVIEVNTLKDAQPGVHGQIDLSGGSFATAGSSAQAQYAWKENVLGLSAAGSMTGHYLNPVVPQNYTNDGTTGDFSAHYERDLTPSDRLSLMVRHALSRFEIPNEQVQETAGQRQDGDNFETMGIISYRHVLSPNTLGTLRGMVRDDSDDLTSNPASTPVIAFLHNHFREGYFNGSLSVHLGRHELKAGVESDSTFLQENFSDIISDPAQFDPGTPLTFAFPGNHPSQGSRPDLEQAAYVQDLMRFGGWTLGAGLRWDHYQLLANQNAVSPRLSLARYFAAANLVLHVSYDRVFQTPAAENILLSSSPQVISLNPNVLRLPVEPSHGNYFEMGATKSFFGQFRFDANYFRRYVDNFADDDQLLSTAVTFPIAFRKAIIYGAEGKLELPQWRRFSGIASYSYMVGNAWFPVSGGLFVGEDAINATTQLSGHFPDSQDQRNTLRLRMRYQALPRFWLAGGAEYGSGLPFDFTGTYQLALAEYGQAVIDRLNFARGRVRPSLAVEISAGADVYKGDRFSTRLQADAQNLNNRLNVMDFGGLFSGNAIAPPRSYALRLETSF